MNVREYIESIAALGDPSFAWLLEHGEEFPYDPERGLPADVQRGRAKECFQNAAYNVILRDDGDDAAYTYVEGHAWCGTIPVHHAWLVDAEGYVVDPTWVHDGSCGFCLGDGAVPGECECEDEDGECWGCAPEDAGCSWCGGSGRDPYAERDSSQRAYFGVRFTAAELRRSVVRSRTWGVLDDPEIYREREVASG